MMKIIINGIIICIKLKIYLIWLLIFSGLNKNLLMIGFSVISIIVIINIVFKISVYRIFNNLIIILFWEFLML